MFAIGEAALAGRLRSLLCLGAHCDDVEIGCGGTVLRLVEANPGLHVDWLVLASDDERAAEARASAAQFLAGAASSSVDVRSFRASYFPYTGAEIKDVFEELKGRARPDVILTHWGGDAHQDHRLVSELTWNTFRDHLVLEYEIPKYDGDLGRPNVYVHLDAPQVERKVEAIMAAFPSQADKHWFDAEAFRGLMRLRGVECASPSGFAEAFHARKLRLL
jgi:LmbE family N-acetylglucosaminyl deacetylase